MFIMVHNEIFEEVNSSIDPLKKCKEHYYCFSHSANEVASCCDFNWNAATARNYFCYYDIRLESSNFEDSCCYEDMKNY
jgi:hypothetical protein